MGDVPGGSVVGALCFQCRGKKSESFSVVSNSLRPHGLYSPWNSPGQNTGVGSLSFLQGIFLTQELNQGLLHCRRSLYQLSYQKSPYIYICLIEQLTRYLPIKFFNMREALLPSKGLPLNQTLLSIIVND